MSAKPPLTRSKRDRPAASINATGAMLDEEDAILHESQIALYQPYRPATLSLASSALRRLRRRP
jgi:hypothetical protein